MLHTMTNHSVALFCLAMSALAGCSESYDRQGLGADSPQAVQVRRMIAALRNAGSDRVEEIMRRQMPTNLQSHRADALKATLTNIVKADSVELTKIDCFGDKVYRASLKLTSAGRRQALHVLLVQAEGKLRWAGRN